MKRIGNIVFCLAVLAAAVPANAQEEVCGSVRRGPQDNYPLDYRGRDAYTLQNLALVNGAHFAPYAENLQKGRFYPYPKGPADDMNYVLMWFPNHHRALAAMARLGARQQTDRPVGANRTIYCFFDRAARIAPDDYMVPMLYGTYFQGLGKYDKALELYKKAESMGPNSVNVAYNMGLLYVDMKEYDKAVPYAVKAYENGVRLPGLKDRLVKAGKWPEGAPGPAARPTAAGAAAKPAAAAQSPATPAPAAPGEGSERAPAK